MPRRNETVLETLVDLPWWVSVIFACLVFVGLRFRRVW